MSACSPSGADEADAVHQAAADHARLVATADNDDLQALWRTTLTNEPAQLRDAGRMLAGATERIQVLDVGEAQPAEEGAEQPSESDLDTEEARQVSISYQLAGTEHEGTVILAPHEGAPLDEPSSWVVVTPLLGSMTVPAVGFGAVVPDTYLGGVHAQIGDDYSGQGLLLYPAVYSVQQRADPYFTSSPADLIIAAGQAAQIPQLDIVGSEETVAILTDQLVHSLETCVTAPGECSASTYDLVESHGVEPYPYDWSMEVTTVPELTMQGSEVAFSGGTLVLRGPGGSETEIAFEGTSPWTLGNQSWTPTLLGYAMDIREAAE